MNVTFPAVASDPRVVSGNGGMPKLLLRADDGAQAEIYLHGAHVTSWRPAGDREDRLYLSARSQFAAGAPIRGGVPVSFPQFATDGPLPHHGFARVLEWTLLPAAASPAAVSDAGRCAPVAAVLRLADNAATRALWPHPFALELTVTVGGRSLELALAVINTGSAPLAFTGALHTYFAVSDVRRALVHGLQGATYRDKVQRRDGIVETASEVRIDGEVDRVYFDAPDSLALREPERLTAIRATGFPDTVVWNPGAERGALIADLAPGGHARMLCVEAAAVRAPVVVAPGARWRGTQTMKAQ